MRARGRTRVRRYRRQDGRAWYSGRRHRGDCAAGEGLALFAGSATGPADRQRSAPVQRAQPAIVPPRPSPGHRRPRPLHRHPDQAEQAVHASNPEEGNSKRWCPRRRASGKIPPPGRCRECACRYIDCMKMSDASGGGWVNVFHEQAVEMLGIGAGSFTSSRRRPQRVRAQDQSRAVLILERHDEGQDRGVPGRARARP